MSTAIIRKSTLNGTVKAPPSKSAAHRLLICCALSKKKCTIENFAMSNDMKATIGCLKALGTKIEINGSKVCIDASDFAKDSECTHYTLNCIESGTTLRLMIPVCAALGLNVTFTGEGRLPNRPIDEYLRILPQHNVSCKYSDNYLPLTISGKLKGERFCVSPAVSSQYVSGLLLALSLLDNDTTLDLSESLVGGQYVDITTDIMRDFGIDIKKEHNCYHIKGSSNFDIQDNSTLYIEGDWSQAAFFLCAGAINSDITVTNLNINSSQGDKAIVDILKSLGADITTKDNSVFVKRSDLVATDIDALDTPDLVPIVAVTCCFAKGESHIHGVSRLRFKESDRLLSTSDMINSLGGECSYTDDCMTIISTHLTGGTVKGYNDHRIVMASSVAGLNTESDTVITDAHSVCKSYSNFFDDYNALGGKADVILG